MSRDLFRQYCAESGVAVVAQHDLPWGSPNDPAGEVTDCISVFTRPPRARFLRSIGWSSASPVVTSLPLVPVQRRSHLEVG